MEKTAELAGLYRFVVPVSVVDSVYKIQKHNFLLIRKSFISKIRRFQLRIGSIKLLGLLIVKE